MRKKIILWTIDIDIVLTDSGALIGGIPIQMFMWSKEFCRNGWEVYSFTVNPAYRNSLLGDINFIYYPNVRLFNPFLTLLVTFRTIMKIRPGAIILSGATRDLLFISLVCKIFGVKLIMLFASDSDLEKGNELISRSLDRKLYRLGLRLTYNFMVQNEVQARNLTRKLKKHNYITVPNIWSEPADAGDDLTRDVILWVGNFRRMKRPGLFLELAREFPGKKFQMVGGNLDPGLYNNCMEESRRIPNMEFCGPVPFYQTREYFKKAYLLVNTSDMEGFPNTFVQAWGNAIPVVSTFDPGGIIQKQHLGIFCKSPGELKKAVELMDEKDVYSTFQQSIRDYMTTAHSSQKYYSQLVEKFNLN